MLVYLLLLLAISCLTQVSGMAAGTVGKEPQDLEATDIDIEVVPQPDLKSCCYEDTLYEHGEVIKSFPRKCMQLVCNNGTIETQLVNSFGESCCEFNGHLYGEGDQLPYQCMELYCKNGEWYTNGVIHECCKHCLIHNDPHFNTFDGHQYDYHGTCNYSLAQSDFTYNPDIGVFSDFVSCNSFASCLHLRTFKNDPHTVIRLTNDVTELHANNYHNSVPLSGIGSVMTSSSTYAPVLMWHDGSYCMFLAGSSGLMLRHCPWRLDIWAHPVHTGRLDGLCGHFNYFTPDDFTSRQEEVYPLSYWPPLQFPVSWRTNVQSNRKCYLEIDNDATLSVNPCRLDGQGLKALTDMCTDAMTKAVKECAAIVALRNQDLDPTHDFIQTCVLDLCLMKQDGATADQVNRWLETLRIIRMLSCDTDWHNNNTVAIKV